MFDICHGCRRCFNLCDSFPRLFDLIDESESGELDTVSSADFKPVVDACTLCDMCFMTKCPYVPPPEFDLDFPHLMLRYWAAEAKHGKVDFRLKQLTKTDRNGRLAGPVAGLVNWASDTKNKLTRPLMESAAGVHREGALPKFHGKTFAMRARTEAPEVNREAPAFGRKAVLYATCFANYNNPGIGLAARAVLARNGVETEVIYPACCGMLRRLPEADVAVIERCSGHGGSWGIMKENFDVGLKVGRPVARQAAESGKAFIASECPLAGAHILQGMERLKDGDGRPTEPASHPIEFFARAYGVMV